MTSTSTTLPSVPVRRGRLGLLLALSLVGGGAAGAFAGAGGLVQLGFPAGALLLALWLLATRRTAQYVEFVLWLWLLAPGLRRIVDLGLGWNPVSPIMLAAPVATLVCLLPALSGRRRLHPTMGASLVIALAAVGYGVLVGVLVVGVGSALAAALAWLPPLALGLYVATSNSVEDADLLAVVRRTALLGCLLLGSYGLLQFVSPPPWDVFWLENAPITSAGYPVPYEVRVFSTLNSPAPFACVLGVLLVLLTGCRGRSRPLAMLAAFVAFGLSVVRTAWLGYVVALFTLLAPGRTRLLRSAVVGIGLPALLLVLYGGLVTEVIASRLTDTTKSGTQDESFTDRVEFYRTVLPQVLVDPVGEGVGSTGVATKVGNAGELGERGNFDGGALEILYVFGLPVGLAFLVSIVLAVRAAWTVASRRGDLEKAMAAALVGLLVQLPLFNPITTPSGIFFWLLVGVLARSSATTATHEAVRVAQSEPRVITSSRRPRARSRSAAS